MIEVPTIMIVDDSEVQLEQLRTLLSSIGYKIITAKDGEQALNLFKKKQPDMLIIDIILPKINGMELCRVVKGYAEDLFLPVILMSASNESEIKVRALKIGADDFLAKPFDTRELTARVNSLLRLKTSYNKTKMTAGNIEDINFKDSDTNVYSNKYLRIKTEESFKQAQRYKDPLSLLLISIDNYDKIISSGDNEDKTRLLLGFTKVLKDTLRSADIIARSDTNTFAALLHKTHFSGSVVVSERLWHRIKENRSYFEVFKNKVEFSIGISFFPGKDVNNQLEFVNSAQQALSRSQLLDEDSISIYLYHDHFYQAGTEILSSTIF